MWAYAQRCLGLTREEFFRLQPRQFDALAKQDRNLVEHQEFMLGQIAAAVVNFSFCRPAKAVKLERFMPSRMRNVKAEPEYQSRKQVAKNVEQILRGFM